MPPHDHQHIVADRRIKVPAGTVRPAEPEGVARAHPVQRGRDRTHRAHGVHETSVAAAQGAGRDGHLADPERVDHRELPRCEGREFPSDRRKFDRPGVGGLGPGVSDAVRQRGRHGAHDGAPPSSRSTGAESGEAGSPVTTPPHPMSRTVSSRAGRRLPR